jgi:hypothetical protein
MGRRAEEVSYPNPPGPICRSQASFLSDAHSVQDSSTGDFIPGADFVARRGIFPGSARSSPMKHIETFRTEACHRRGIKSCRITSRKI